MPTWTRRHLATAALGLATAAAAGWFLIGPGGARAAAPAVRYTLLDGRQVASADLAGQVVLVNFWATTCAPCLAEMPHIVAAFDKFRGRGFQALAVAMAYDPPAFVADYAMRRKLPFGVAIDATGEIAQRFGDVQFTPTSFLIDKRGRIAQRWVGKPDFAALERLVEQLLAEA